MNARGPAPAARRFVDDNLAYLLARASAVVSGQFHRQVRDAGLSVAQWRVLAALSGGDGVPITELAAIVLMQQPTLTKLVDRLVSEGLVTRGGNPVDRRQALVHVTARGAAQVHALLPRAAAHEAQMLAGCQPEAIAELKRQLRALIALVDGPPAASPRRPRAHRAHAHAALRR